MTKQDGDRRLVYGVPEAGEMLGLNRNAAYAAAKRGDIPVIRIGKLLRVPKVAFDQMLERGGAK
jgi:excisionase family DNA binding protein